MYACLGTACAATHTLPVAPTAFLRPLASVCNGPCKRTFAETARVSPAGLCCPHLAQKVLHCVSPAASVPFVPFSVRLPGL